MDTAQTGLMYYQQFIDGLVERSEGVLAKWVLAGRWPDVEENKAVNDLLQTLSPEQKKTLADMIQRARSGGMHDVLAYMNEEIEIEELRLAKKNVPFPLDPYDSGLHYAFVSRMEGDTWPENPDLEAPGA